MYTRILIPLDGSMVAEEALAHAVQMADLFGAELVLLRAAFLPQLPDDDLADAQPLLIRDSEAYLYEMARRLEGQGQRVHTVVRWRQAAEAIIEYAVEQDVSVVVMTTHGHSRLDQWPIGSTAEKVLRCMQVPVLLIRASQRPS